MHQDKVFLRIVREMTITVLTRDYRAVLNKDIDIRPTWMGIKIVGYTFYHEKTEISKRNKQNLARHVHKLMKKGVPEEDIRIRVASNFGYIKHADSINFIKTIGMEKSLGKIIKNRRVKPPFKGLKPEDKEPFSKLIVKNPDNVGGG